MKPLVTEEQIRELVDQALLTLEAVSARQLDGLEDEGLIAEREMANAALLFGLRVTGQLGGPALAGSFAAAALELSNVDYDAGGLGYVGVTAITKYVRQLGIDSPLAPLAAARSSDVRQAVAEGLDTSRPKDLALLMKYFASSDGLVSAAARKVLEKGGTATWWLGRFAADPTHQISGAPEVQARVRAWVEAFTRLSDYPRPKESELLKPFKRLPPALRSSAAEAVLNVALAHRQLELTRECLETEGGRRALHATIEGGDIESSARYSLEQMISKCSADARRAIADALLNLIEQASPATWGTWDSSLQGATTILKEVWEPSWPIERIMELLQRTDLPDTLHLGAIAECLDGTTAAGAWHGRFEDLLLSGFPGMGYGVQSRIVAILDALPAEQLRALTERALRADDESAKAWALGHILGDVYSPSRDGTREAVVGRLCADAQLKRLIIDQSALVLRALVVLRKELLDPAMPLQARARVMLAIGDLNEELNPLSSPGGWLEFRQHRASAGAPRSASEADVKDAQTWSPRDLRPLTEQEWASFRKQRDALDLRNSTPELHLVIRLLPLEPNADDRRFVERLSAHALEQTKKEQDWLRTAAFGGLLSFRRRDDVPTLEKLLDGDDYLRQFGGPALKELFPEPKAKPAAAEEVNQDW